MRPWQEYLLNYGPATEDFLAWIEEAKSNIIRQIEEAAQSGDSAKITPLANELTVYKRIGDRFRAEFRERQSQIERR